MHICPMIGLNTPDYEFIAYIDESGDPGIKRVRPIDEVGGTEWLTISAVLVRRENDNLIPNWVSDICRNTNSKSTRVLKFTEMQSHEKLLASRMTGELPIRTFVVATNKKNMRGYSNQRAEKRGAKQWFYNWIVRILIERVTDYCFRYAERHNLQRKHVKFVFSQSGGHSYSQTTAYHELLKSQSQASSTYLKRYQPNWQVMHWSLVESFPHYKRAGLQLADVLASAVYHGVDQLDTGPCAPEYAMAIRSRFAMSKYSRRDDYGLVLQPWPPWKADITEQQKELFRFFGYDFTKKW